jgi:NADH-quinone oxidoreductase subunit G
MFEIEIDGKTLSVPQGSTVMEAANQLGIYVPHFCYHRKLSIAANCRMCLVEVEKAPKPLPACATPVANGMKVKTHSDAAVGAQKAVMEFLLINHPLDCPICDQGGECQLQDLSVGYGGVDSRYGEDKRVVPNKNLGALISTDMTRCIHCTRCVRFGQEIAGVMELGMSGRGEHSEIMPFVSKTVDSELSGNMIDLCPVGALTSKPFRYSARGWELSNRRSVSPHCSLGSNLTIQVKNNKVMRVLPHDNDAINECWISDKDRFSYEGLNSPDRLEKPMIKQGGEWREVEWNVALDYVARGLKDIVQNHGAQGIGSLASPHSTLEELHLLQKLARGMGSENIDFRLRRSDFRASPKAPWLGMKIADLDSLDRVLVIGSMLNQDQPLIANRLRQAAKSGMEVNVVNPTSDNFRIKLANQAVVPLSEMAAALEAILAGLSGKGKGEAKAIAQSLKSGKNVGIFLGNIAEQHYDASRLHVLASKIAEKCEGKLGFFGEAANSVGGHLVKAVPAAGGLNALGMIVSPRKGYLLWNCEPELDMMNPAAALEAMDKAEMVVVFSPYRHRAHDYADVLLPISPFTETSGTFVNTEGRVQSFKGAVAPRGESRPGWKVLRVLGNLLGIEGFDYEDTESVLKEIGLPEYAQCDNSIDAEIESLGAQEGLQRIGHAPIYFADGLARRSESLQATRLSAVPCAFMNAKLLKKLGLEEGNPVLVKQGAGEARLNAALDDRLADDCVLVAAGHPETSALGALFGAISVERL